MRINKKIVTIMTVVVSLCWIWNINVFNKNRINDFIFLNHYQDIKVTNRLGSYDEEYVEYFNSLPEYAQRNAAYTQINNMHLQYVKDYYNNEIIQSVKIPQLSDYDIPVREDILSKKYNEPIVIQLTIMLDEIPYEDKYDLVKCIKNDDVVINELIFKTSSGKAYGVNIGEIYFNYDERYYLEEDTTNGVWKEAVDIRLDSMDTYFENIVNENYEFYTYEEGIEEVVINIPYIAKGKHFFDIYPRMISDGKEFNKSIVNIDVNFKGETSLGEDYSKNISISNQYSSFNLSKYNELMDNGHITTEIKGE